MMMTSASPVEANRLDPLKPGLSGAQIVLPHEDPAAFDNLKASLFAQHKPVGVTEELLVSNLADSWWRMLRARRVEALFLNQCLANTTGDAAVVALVSAPDDKALAKIERYVNAADRAFKSALTHLRQAQRSRYKEEVAQLLETMAASGRIFRGPAPARAQPAGASAPAPSPAPKPPETGFVSRSQPASALLSFPKPALDGPKPALDGFWLKNPRPDPRSGFDI